MTITPRVVATAAELLRELASARQVFHLYPEGHPNRHEAARAAARQAAELRAVLPDDPLLFVARHSLYLGATLLARESLSLFRLVEALERAGVEAVEFVDDPAVADLAAFCAALDAGGPLRERYGAVVVNRVRPGLPGDEQRESALGALRHAYARGLQVLRETSVRLAAGEPLDLDTTNQVVQHLADEVIRDPSSALLLTTLKSYDEYTYYHLVNVAVLSIALGHAMGLHREQVVALGLGGLLHDVGKLHLPQDVLLHVGGLTEEQWRLVQRHPVDGASLVFGTREGLFHPAATVVLEHHAAYDLSGYPSLSHRAHPSLPARLVAVADCFDAVTSKRSYRAPADRRQALAILEGGIGTGFDPRVVRLFAGTLGLFPVGSMVELDTGETAVVVGNHDRELGAPRVLVVLDPRGDVRDPEERDLAERDQRGEQRWRVRRTVDPERLGLDVMTLLSTGEVDLAAARDAEPETGLVHEPSHGEPAPDGYVDTHAHAHEHDLDGAVDPDVAPPF